MVFLPIQPSPLRSATARSARGLLSTKMRAPTGRPAMAGRRSTRSRARAFSTSW